MTKRIVSLLTALLLATAPALAAAAAEPADLDVIIALDVSGSMTTERLRPAVEAATYFVSQLPAGVRCGLVTFGSEARLVVPPTADRQQLNSQLAAATAYGNTALYDGIKISLDALAASAKSHVIVLSDGRDTVSQTSLAALLAQIQGQSTTVSVIAIEPDPVQVNLLEQIVTAAGGELIQPAGVDDFVESFIAALTPPTPNPTPTPEPGTGVSLPLWTPAALAFAVSAIVLSLYLSARGTVAELTAGRTLARLVNSYSEVAAAGGAPAPKADLQALRKRLTASFAKTAQRLDQAQLALSIELWVGFLVLLWLLSLLLLNAFTGSAPVALIGSLVIANRLPHSLLQRRINSRLRQFEEALPTMLSVVSSSLRAGLTFAQALDTAVADDPGEMGRQMRRALTEMRVGATLDEALLRVAERMNSEDLKWAVTGLAIQREVGGSLSKILDTSADAIRSRAELRREVRTLSAEGRLSAYVLAGLPVLIFGFLGVSRPDYIRVFWSEPIGFVMLVAMLAAFAVGWTWLNKLVQIKV